MQLIFELDSLFALSPSQKQPEGAREEALLSAFRSVNMKYGQVFDASLFQHHSLINLGSSSEKVFVFTILLYSVAICPTVDT